MSENQIKSIQKVKPEAMVLLAQGIVTDFKPVLEEIKILIPKNASQEIISQKIDILLNLLNQLEKFSMIQSKYISNDQLSLY